MNIKDLPPDLPPVPLQDNNDKVADKLLPPLPTTDPEHAVAKVKQTRETRRAKKTKTVDKVKITKKAIDESDDYLQLGLAIIIVSVILGLFLILKGRLWSPSLKPQDITLHAALNQIKKIPLAKGPVIKIKKVAKKDLFVLLSNYDQDAYVELSMTSLTGQILSREPVSFVSRSFYRHHYSYFNNFEMLKGLNLTYGEYEYRLSFSPVAGGKGLETSGRVLLSHEAPDVFSKRLKAYHRQMKKKYVDPLREKLNRYQTFSQLAMKALDHYKAVVGTIKKGREISKFETLYNGDVGPFLRDLIIDANRLHMSYLNVDPELSRSYEEVLSFGKRVGEMASDMVTETRKLKKITKTKRSILIHKFEKIYDDLSYQVTDEKKIIDKELKKYPSYLETL